MAKATRPVPGSRAEALLDQLLTEVKGLRADLRHTDETPAEPAPAVLGVLEASDG